MKTKTMAEKPHEGLEISTGTLRPQDLLYAYADAIEQYCDSDGTVVRDMRLYAEVLEHSEFGTKNYNDAQEQADWLINEVGDDMLHEVAPRRCYFGSHYGDGALIGFWQLDAHDLELEDWDYIGDVGIEHGGVFYNLNDWHSCLVETVQVCSVEGAVIIEKGYTIIADKKNIWCALDFGGHDKVTGNDAKSRKMFILECLSSYNGIEIHNDQVYILVYDIDLYDDRGINIQDPVYLDGDYINYEVLEWLIQNEMLNGFS